jgi:hypothetical protein
MRLATLAVFIGSFLLFLIQPMLGRTLLPMFGGSAAVWTVCLAAYQVLLLAGYAYAHGVARLAVPSQRRLHAGLLCAACLWAAAFAALRPLAKTVFGGSSVPSLEVLFCVLAFAGFPYVMLAAGSTLVQAWAAGGGRKSVYRLYAVSNMGAFAGLLAYPFALEPFVSLTAQWWGVAAALAAYAGLMANAGLVAKCPAAVAAADGGGDACVFGGPAWERPDARTFKALWFLLPGVSVFLLNAVVAHLFSDVTPMPLAWVVMLAAFLLSYGVGFSRVASVGRVAWCGLAAASLAGAAWANGMWGAGSFYPNAAAGVAVVFFGGVVLHGWLYDERPPAAGLTRYYLAVAAGGAAGGLLAAVAAPLVFKRVAEYPLALCACAFWVAWRVCGGLGTGRAAPRVRRARAAAVATVCAAAWLALYAATARRTSSRTLYRGRNFYGTVRVTQTVEPFGQLGMLPVHYLWCGQTTHGLQVRAPLLERRGTSYYGRTGGGIAFASHPKTGTGQGMKVGVVGLGAGCLACYGRPTDLFRFYEINPLMVEVAGNPGLFSFLRDAPMPIDIVPGDARKMMEKEAAAGDPLYDILVIDAYSGDAVPYHLATVEAFRLYFGRLEADGILAVHVSNWHIDLLPLCKAVSAALGVQACGVVGVADDPMTTDSIWVFMTRGPFAFRLPGQRSAREVAWEKIRDVSVPSDDKGSLTQLLRPLDIQVGIQ